MLWKCILCCSKKNEGLYKTVCFAFMLIYFLFFTDNKIECLVDKKCIFGTFWVFEFNLDAKDAELTPKICKVYDSKAMLHRAAQNWFKRFRDDNFYLTDMHRTGFSVQSDQ